VSILVNTEAPSYHQHLSYKPAHKTTFYCPFQALLITDSQH